MVEHPNSPLPRDPEYWESLAQRIRADAAGPLAGYATTVAWYDVLARQAAWLVAAAAIVIVALLLTLPQPDPDAAYRWIERSLAPDEPAGTLIAGPTAPSVDVVMVQFPPAGGDPRVR